MASTMQTDNSNIPMKVAIREWILSQIEPAAVFDLYCGQGIMYREVWSKAERYFGIDKREPHRLAPTMKCTAEAMVQTRAIDRYNVYDVDTYSNPWIVARRICRNRKSGRFAMALTHGLARGLAGGGHREGNELLRRSIGASGLSTTHLYGRYTDLILLLLIRALGEIPGITLLSAMQAETTKHIVYLGIVLDKGPEIA